MSTASRRRAPGTEPTWASEQTRWWADAKQRDAAFTARLRKRHADLEGVVTAPQTSVARLSPHGPAQASPAGFTFPATVEF